MSSLSVCSLTRPGLECLRINTYFCGDTAQPLHARVDIIHGRQSKHDLKFCKSHIPIVTLNLHNEWTHTHEITWQPIWIGTCRDAEQGLQGFTTAKGPSWEYGAKDQDRGREDESRLDNENSNYILFQQFKNWHLFNWLILDSPIWCLIVNSSILNCAKLYSSWMGYRRSVSFLVIVISFSNCIFNIIVNGSHHDSGSHDQSWPGGM